MFAANSLYTYIKPRRDSSSLSQRCSSSAVPVLLGATLAHIARWLRRRVTALSG